MCPLIYTLVMSTAIILCIMDILIQVNPCNPISYYPGFSDVKNQGIPLCFTIFLQCPFDIVLFCLFFKLTTPVMCIIEKSDNTSGPCDNIMLNINYCCGMFTDYISARAHYSRVRSTLVPSVACQTTEGKYHSY